jgi:Peptidase family M28
VIATGFGNRRLSLVLFVLTCGTLWSQNSGGRGGRPGTTPGAVTRLIEILREATAPDQAARDVRTIWETDRWFTFPKFAETAKNVAAIMKRAGLEEIEIGTPPADGVTQGGFWTMPLAWDIHVGTLEILDPQVPAPQRVLADYQKVPTSIGMWSGPTPAGGVVTEVVLAPANFENADLKGKLVLGARGSKTTLAKACALGLISENSENRELADERGWVNSFGDNGWSFTKGSAPLVCFSVTPRGSLLLRELLKKGPVKVRANVDSRYYAGVYPYVTGVIRGTGGSNAEGSNAEEVLSLGHLFEQGAHDNATGVASIIGAAETLNRLIQAGKLSRPKRTIRVLGMGECYGTMSYLEQNRDRVKRTVAAMCIDSPAGLQNLAGTEYTWILNPHSAKSYVDALVLRLAEEYYPSVGRPWGWQEHRSSTDNYLGDPAIGIPTVMPHGGYGVNAHHNSYDTPATVDPKSLRDMMVMNAAYAYWIAAAGPAENRWMAEVALTRGQNQVAAGAQKVLDQIAVAPDAERLGRLAWQARERIEYSLARETQAVRSAWDLKEGLADLAAFAAQQTARLDRAIRDRATALGLGPVQPLPPPRNPEAEKIVVRRKRMGTITLDDLPREARENYPAASFWGVPVSALYWCDGKRNLAEVMRLTELEMGQQQFDFVGYFKFLEKHGYVEFVR